MRGARAYRRTSHRPISLVRLNGHDEACLFMADLFSDSTLDSGIPISDSRLAIPDWGLGIEHLFDCAENVYRYRVPRSFSVEAQPPAFGRLSSITFTHAR